MHIKRAFPAATAGVALVEFAIAIPILIMVLVGLIEYGRYAYFVIEIGNAAHAGAIRRTGREQRRKRHRYEERRDPRRAEQHLPADRVGGEREKCVRLLDRHRRGPFTSNRGAMRTAAPAVRRRPQVTYAQVTVTGMISPLFNYSLLGLPSSWTATRTATIRILTQ